MTWKTAYTYIRSGTIIFLWSLAIAIIAVNILFDPFLSRSEERRLQQRVLLQPFRPQTHEALGAYYRQGNIPAAQREYILAAALLNEQSPDGAVTSSSVQAWDMYKQKQLEISQERQLWERVYATVPEYQYAGVKLAHLAYQAGDLPAARKYLLIAREQAPWDATVASLSEALK